MNRQDIDLYVKARRQQKWVFAVSAAGIVIGVAACAFLLGGIGGPVAKGVLIGAFSGSVLANTNWSVFSGAISRRSLLDIIERQISRDPEAVAYLASKFSAHRVA
jgi:hypothetical protein